MTRRRLPVAERREEVIAAATEVFCRCGYVGSNLREIAAAADISLAGLLHHFETKEGLLLAVLDAQDNARYAQVVRPIDQASLAEEIIGIVRARAANPRLLKLWVVLDAEATDPSHPAHARIVEQYRRRTANLASSLAARVDAGQLDASLDPMHAATVLLAFLHGLYTRMALDPTTDAEGLTSSFLAMSPWVTGSPVRG